MLSLGSGYSCGVVTLPVTAGKLPCSSPIPALLFIKYKAGGNHLKLITNFGIFHAFSVLLRMLLVGGVVVQNSCFFFF